MPVIKAEHRWVCPNCAFKDTTSENNPHTRFHRCAGLRGLTVPMVLEGTNCKVEVHEREDYVGDELVATDGYGRPVMSVIVTRDDGQDCAVFAPTAQARGEVG